MTVPWRRPRDVYRVYPEHEFLLDPYGALDRSFGLAIEPPILTATPQPPKRSLGGAVHRRSLPRLGAAMSLAAMLGTIAGLVAAAQPPLPLARPARGTTPAIAARSLARPAVMTQSRPHPLRHLAPVRPHAPRRSPRARMVKAPRAAPLRAERDGPSTARATSAAAAPASRAVAASSTAAAQSSAPARPRVSERGFSRRAPTRADFTFERR
jgi:hypothetical protein